MAFITENGTGVKGATAYGTVDGFKDYFADRTEDVSAITDPTIQQLLVAATDYIDTRWGHKFLGQRQFKALTSRSVLTLTAAAADGESVTFGAQTYVFRTATGSTNEVAIGTSALKTLANLVTVMGQSDNDDFVGFLFADPDVAAVTLYASEDGVASTTTLANGSFDGAATGGQSAKRQRLEFPRLYLDDRCGDPVEGIPDNLLAATYEYALRANAAALAPDPTVDASGARVTGNRTKVGPIETEVSFAENTTIQITKPYPQADRLLKEYVTIGGTFRA